MVVVERYGDLNASWKTLDNIYDLPWTIGEESRCFAASMKLDLSSFSLKWAGYVINLNKLDGKFFYSIQNHST